MNILEKIIARKSKEVAAKKNDVPEQELEKGRYFSRQTLSLRKRLLDDKHTGIIAEYKRRSPSKGIINDRDSVEAVTMAYTAYGASGISILTDLEFFGGSLDDLISARDNGIPLLRKDFMIDEYQITEAKAYGADVILLIAACLSPLRVKQLAQKAKELGLEVLLELHDESELDHICELVDLVGVNNRNLKTFEVDLEHSTRLAEKIGSDFVKVAESGINDVNNIRYLKAHGFQGFLIGEYFMKQKSPMEAFKNFSYSL
ncbi:indole-3-glycerol phosphate synthase TrpC [Flavisolibacter ginsengisoli]|jgi:indole-3-glycerol phosphate synthase|uniref:indole-3-glycerol-phosphate synthase n=1 Tax=Flavisolibacter ginsengisoli DSM 18119 TaxID=1121884 RepID=A0A1M5BFH5_9BACT|nr:indole-3-glycerol phosphate synthase TrpC [Flavisolibacter ginsengisoli]SHF41198.1 indole-3-glycerol phosphate synthase [Flavisolibacter ginsengisoli DSM 18119]